MPAQLNTFHIIIAHFAASMFHSKYEFIFVCFLNIWCALDMYIPYILTTFVFTSGPFLIIWHALTHKDWIIMKVHWQWQICTLLLKWICSIWICKLWYKKWTCNWVMYTFDVCLFWSDNTVLNVFTINILNKINISKQM